MASESCMMPMGSSAYSNPYWMGIQGGMEGYMGPYNAAVPFMGYGLAPLEMQFGGVMPPVVPFGAQNLMMPHPPMQFQSGVGLRRNIAEGGVRMGTGNMKANPRNQSEHERRAERGVHRDWQVGRESGFNHSGGGDSSLKPKERPAALHAHHHRPERRLQESGRRESKRKAEHRHEGGSDRAGDGVLDRCDENEGDIGSGDAIFLHRQHQLSTSTSSKSALIDSKKGSVFSRISFPEEKQKNVPIGARDEGVDVPSEASDDDERHFRRKINRVEPPRPPVSKH